MASIERLDFHDDKAPAWHDPAGRLSNWPVVYLLDGGTDVYVGETLNARARMAQHRAKPEKRHLKGVRVVVDETFNKSVCLDLESQLITLLAGDGRFNVLNVVGGITDADYYNREQYRREFAQIFDDLRRDDLFAKTIEEIQNSELFKLSPFKALNHDQEVALVDILNGIFEDLASGAENTVVIQGAPGTGKTIVAIHLIKLLADIASPWTSDDVPEDSVFADFFQEDCREALKDFRMALVVPQTSLRTSIKRVFKKVPGLSQKMVIGPADVAKADRPYDLVVVDEAHRLGRYGAHTSRGAFKAQSQRLARPGERWEEITQLDWLLRTSKTRVLLVDREQSVRPLDLAGEEVDRVVSDAGRLGRLYPLRSQMRVAGGNDYISFVDALLRGGADAAPRAFPGYELKLFDSVRSMREAIFARDAEVGLSRMLAGYAWDWVSQDDPTRPDICIDGLELFWNRATTDWITSPTALEEVGSIHKVQGYDLNYAGVIIGPDLYWDRERRRIAVNRDQYADSKGKSGSPTLGVVVDDDALLVLVRNIYRVLLTRGMRGTYVYVCDPALREYMRRYFVG